LMVVLPPKEVESFKSLSRHESPPWVLGYVVAHDGEHPQVEVAGMVFE
jgi:hypothetical protein